MDWLDGGEDLLTAQRERDKPRQGVVANTLNLFRNGAACRVFLFTLVASFDWLDVSWQRQGRIFQEFHR